MGYPVTVNEGTGTDVVNISPKAESLGNGNIRGPVLVNGGGNDTLNVYDQNDTSSTDTMASASTNWYVYRPGAAYIIYNHVNAVNVNGSHAGATYNVQATEPGGTTHIIAGGNSTVNVGNGHTVSGIQGTLNIENPPSFNTINIDDSLDLNQHTVTLSTMTTNPDGTNNPWGQIVGLSAPINYAYSDTNSVTVQGGTAGQGGHAGNTWNVQATGPNTYHPTTGVITNIVDGGLAGNPGGQGGIGQVNVGYNGHVQSIQGILNLQNPTSFNNITVGDSADITPRTITLSTLGTNPTAFDDDSSFATSIWGQVLGLGSAPINYEYVDASSLTVQGGDSGQLWQHLERPSHRL